MASAMRTTWGRAFALALSLALAAALVPTCALGQTLTYDFKGEGVSDMTTKLVVTKVDQNRLYVKGAVLAICRADTGEELLRCTTEGGEHVFDRYLNSGTPLNVTTHYLIKEIETPEGYEPAENTEFYIDSYGNVVVVGGEDAEAENRNQVVLTDVRLLAYETEYVERTREGSQPQAQKDEANPLRRLAQTSDELGLALLVLGGVAVVAFAASAFCLAKRRMRK